MMMMTHTGDRNQLLKLKNKIMLFLYKSGVMLFLYKIMLFIYELFLYNHFSIYFIVEDSPVSAFIGSSILFSFVPIVFSGKNQHPMQALASIICIFQGIRFAKFQTERTRFLCLEVLKSAVQLFLKQWLYRNF